jgi:hypothetical protein
MGGALDSYAGDGIKGIVPQSYDFPCYLLGNVIYVIKISCKESIKFMKGRKPQRTLNNFSAVFY